MAGPTPDLRKHHRKAAPPQTPRGTRPGVRLRSQLEGCEGGALKSLLRWPGVSDAEVNVTCYPKGVGEIFGEMLGEILGEMLGEMLLRCRCLTHQFDHLTGI